MSRSETAGSTPAERSSAGISGQMSGDPTLEGRTDQAPVEPAGVSAPQPDLGREAAAGPRKARASRAGRAWVGVAIGVLALIVVLVFILQNLHSVRLSFFTASGSFPLAVALLFAAVLGALCVLLLGSIRIVQLRLQVRRRGRRHDAVTGVPGAPRP